MRLKTETKPYSTSTTTIEIRTTQKSRQLQTQFGIHFGSQRIKSISPSVSTSPGVAQDHWIKNFKENSNNFTKYRENVSPTCWNHVDFWMSPRYWNTSSYLENRNYLSCYQRDNKIKSEKSSVFVPITPKILFELSSKGLKMLGSTYNAVVKTSISSLHVR